MTFGWFRHTITVVRAARTTDRYGNPVLDWDAATRHDVRRCRVQPVQGSRVNMAETIPRDGVETRRRVFIPAGADIDHLDRIEYLGLTYQIDGDVDAWPSPTGRLAHIELMLSRVEG